MVKKNSGLGDTIESITTATGIKAVVEKLEEIFDFDCGCEQRKQALNKLFPYTKVECLTESEFNYLKGFNWNINTLHPGTQVELLKIYNRVFNSNRGMTSCVSCWNEIISSLKKVYLEYEHTNSKPDKV